MSEGALVVLIIFISLGAWALFMVYLRARPASAPEIEDSIMAPGSELTPRPRASFDDAAGVTRRQFLNRAYVAGIAVALTNFALASLDYLWPRSSGGFGGKITMGDASQLRSQLES